MKISDNGLNLVKSFESCKLKAYKCVSTEKYYTIGWGHYGVDVKADMVITQEQADSMLVSDIKKFEKYVNATGLELNQNQFDALVSFTYNCGNANLKKLIINRTLSEISDALLLYNKSGGKALSGLVRRREAEKKLFDTPIAAKDNVTYYPKCTCASCSIIDLLKRINVDSSFSNRKNIAIANGIADYKGLNYQNLKLCNLLKKGELIKPQV